MCLDVVLDHGADAPCRHLPQLGFDVRELGDEGVPQAERGEVVGVVDVLDELLEVVEGGGLGFEGRVRILDDGHGFAHKVGIGRAAHEVGEGLGVEAAGLGRFYGLWQLCAVWVGGGGVLDAPLQERVEPWVHDERL